MFCLGEATMLHCKSCGTLLYLDDLFCGQCGYVMDETKEVLNSGNYRRGDSYIPSTPPPLRRPSDPRLMNGEQSQWGPTTPPTLGRASSPRISNGGTSQQSP